MKFTSPGWTEFDTSATTLALHGGGQAREQTGKADTGAKHAGNMLYRVLGGATGTSLCPISIAWGCIHHATDPARE